MLIKDIKKGKLKVIFKTYNKITKDKVNKAKILKLLAKEVIKIGFFTILTL